MMRAEIQSFAGAIADHGFGELRRSVPRTLQLNVGKLCNQACHHCHVDAGPKRTEQMSRGTAAAAIDLIRRSASIDAVDITGGAPELNPNFAMVVEGARALGRGVIVRCNLTEIRVQLRGTA